MTTHFNSRPSARGDPDGGVARRNRRDFNSRPSARGDLLLRAGRELHVISIHAPPRGATRHQLGFLGFVQFQFTPLREGRPAR